METTINIRKIKFHANFGQNIEKETKKIINRSKTNECK